MQNVITNREITMPNVLRVTAIHENNHVVTNKLNDLKVWDDVHLVAYLSIGNGAIAATSMQDRVLQYRSCLHRHWQTCGVKIVLSCTFVVLVRCRSISGMERGTIVAYLSVSGGGVSNVGRRQLAICPEAGHQLGGIAVKVVADICQADLAAVQVLEGGVD